MRIRPALPDDRAFVLPAAHRLASFRPAGVATFHAARAVYEHLGYAPETLRYVKIL